MKRSSLTVAVTLAALLPAGAAHAYCRTSSCPNVGTAQVCNPPQDGDCGIPLFWAKPCVEYSVQKDASKKGITFVQTEQLLTTAFAAWMSATCDGGGSPRIKVTEGDPATCTKHEYNQMAGNANIVVFRDDMWPYEGSPNTLALTTVTYNLDTGEIYDADIELNSADNDFTVGDTAVMYDLLSILTHETGHFLGLAHSADITATMFPTYNPGQLDQRSLAPDDIKGMCTIYPPGSAIPSDCDPTPRHGFSPLCADQQTGGDTGGTTGSGGCSAGSGAPAGSYGAALALAALAFAANRRRRR